MPFSTRWRLRLVTPLLWLACGLASAQNPPVAADAPGAPASAAQPSAAQAAALSRDARRIHELSRDKLLQIRTLLRTSNTQASIGSGFFVSADGLIVTNFHVASQLALEPERYRGVYVTIDGQEGDVDLLAFDVQHDVAVLRARGRTSPAPVLEFRPAAEALAQGERIYSLGNPLDIGFAVTEGTYNGLVRRSFYPRIFFGGTLNPGMSGGPAVDDAGRVLGVNVAKRLDGEQVSFLIPAEFAQALVQRAASAQPITQPAHKEVARQLLVHQQLLTERFLQTPFHDQRHGNYLVPVPDDALARCWGSGRDPDYSALHLERSACQTNSHVVAGDFSTGSRKLISATLRGSPSTRTKLAKKPSPAPCASAVVGTPSRRKRSATGCAGTPASIAGWKMRAWKVCTRSPGRMPPSGNTATARPSRRRSTMTCATAASDSVLPRRW